MTFLSIMRKTAITVAAAGTLAFAAAGVSSAETSAPAHAVRQSSEPVAVTQVQQGGEGQVRPLGTNECTDHLANFGYEVTNLRFSICLAAAIIGTPTAAATCAGALWTTGVDAITAGEACLLAILPTAASPSARAV